MADRQGIREDTCQWIAKGVELIFANNAPSSNIKKMITSGRLPVPAGLSKNEIQEMGPAIEACLVVGEMDRKLFQ
jgi:hypothetical protein